VHLHLGDFGFPSRLEVWVYTLYELEEIYLEVRPEYIGGKACRLELVAV